MCLNEENEYPRQFIGNVNEQVSYKSVLFSGEATSFPRVYRVFQDHCVQNEVHGETILCLFMVWAPNKILRVRV